ncbi:MAG: RNA 3'-phosphate cyclase [Nitrospirae bacterium]|nr:RNA 3'-phosphate cyclase [Nitrospirota bacterium]
MLHIDGSFGEGGGQILRTALALSSILQKPIHIFNIRKGRKRPGLMPQHLMCVRALKEITDAETKGDSKGSTELYFSPQRIRPGSYSFDIGTAGSATLLLQALLPPLLFSDSPSIVEITGGTHVPFSPPFDYFKEVLVQLLKRLGFRIRADIESYGFYPVGGGRVTVEINPADSFKHIELTERGALMSIEGISAVGGLPLSIAERQKNEAEAILSSRGFSPEIKTASVPTPGKGTYIFLKVVAENIAAGFSSLGARGKRAEAVGEEAVEELIQYINSNACLDHHLSDQILVYITLIGGQWRLSTSRITEHLRTNLWLIGRFLDVEYKIEDSVVEIKSKGVSQIHR